MANTQQTWQATKSLGMVAMKALQGYSVHDSFAVGIVMQMLLLRQKLICWYSLLMPKRTATKVEGLS